MATSRALNPDLMFSNAWSSLTLTVSLHCFSPRGCLGTRTAPQGMGTAPSLTESKKSFHCTLRHVVWLLGFPVQDQMLYWMVLMGAFQLRKLCFYKIFWMDWASFSSTAANVPLCCPPLLRIAAVCISMAPLSSRPSVNFLQSAFQTNSSFTDPHCFS